MASISIAGIGSGLDISNIVAQLVAAERAPVQTRLDSREAGALSKLSAVGTVRSALGSFQGALASLRELSAFQGRTAQSANEDVFTATAAANAAPGRYAVEVVSLASAHKLRSDPYASAETVIGSGTLTISSGGQAFAVEISEPNDTLLEIAAAINSAENNNSTVTATIVTGDDGAHLVLTAAEAGTQGTITVQATGDPGLDALAYDPGGSPQNLTEITAPADASLLIDGLVVTSSENLVADAITGVTLDIAAVDPGTTHLLTVDFDREAAREKIVALVDSYNALLQTVRDQTQFDPETFAAAPLFGEQAITSMVNQIRSAVSGFADDSGTFRALAEIGITTSLDGSLTTDTAALDQALAQGFNDVGSLFTGETGLATQLDGLVDAFLDPASALETRAEGLEAQIADITTQREALDRRMLSVEQRLTAQFNALDTLLGQLNNTSTFLSQQLANLPGSSIDRG